MQCGILIGIVLYLVFGLKTMLILNVVALVLVTVWLLWDRHASMPESNRCPVGNLSTHTDCLGQSS